MGYFALVEDSNDPVSLVKNAVDNLKLFLQTPDPRNEPYEYLLEMAENSIRKAKERYNENCTYNRFDYK